MSCCFYGCHRSGELVLKNAKDELDWRKIIKRGSLVFDSNHVTYRLPYHKTDRFYQGTDILFSVQHVADPVLLLKSYVSRHDKIHGARAALFIRKDGSLPNRMWFDTKFFAILDRQYGGHSLRAGGATFYASLGLSEDVIQSLGRWSSKAWKIYIRDNHTIRAELQLTHLRSRH